MGRPIRGLPVQLCGLARKRCRNRKGFGTGNLFCRFELGQKINSKKGKAEVRINYSSDSDAEGDWLEQQVADPFSKDGDNILENEELGLAIQDCITKLPQKQALVFKLKTIQGMSTEDVCNELDINPSNLWVMIHRARTALMGCLNENWF